MHNKYIRGNDGNYIRNPLYDKDECLEIHVSVIDEESVVTKVSITARIQHTHTRKHTNAGSIPHWALIRKAILERDDYTCRICCTDGGEAQLHVHHIDYVREHNEDDNLITLCTTCHHQVHLEHYIPCEHDDYPTPW